MYDMANIKKLKLLGEGAPAAWEGFAAFDKAAMADGAVPKKYKELIALGVALTTQCPFRSEAAGGGCAGGVGGVRGVRQGGDGRWGCAKEVQRADRAGRGADNAVSVLPGDSPKGGGGSGGDAADR